MGYVVRQDETGAVGKISTAQVETLRTALLVLRRIFPKATVKVIKNTTSAATRTITRELTRDILGNLIK